MLYNGKKILLFSINRLITMLDILYYDSFLLNNRVFDEEFYYAMGAWTIITFLTSLFEDLQFVHAKQTKLGIHSMKQLVSQLVIPKSYCAYYGPLSRLQSRNGKFNTR